VSCLSLHNIVFVDANRSHQTKRAEPLSYNIGLDITVVVFASPYKASVALYSLCNKIINQTMFIVDALRFELIFVVLGVFLRENVHKKSIVLFEDSVLS
jgi:hypothetical protein